MKDKSEGCGANSYSFERARGEVESERIFVVELTRTGSSFRGFFEGGGDSGVSDDAVGDFGRVERGIGMGGGRVGNKKSKSRPPPPSTGVAGLEEAYTTSVRLAGLLIALEWKRGLLTETSSQESRSF